MKKHGGENRISKTTKPTTSPGSKAGGAGSANGPGTKAAGGWSRPKPLAGILKPAELKPLLTPAQQSRLDECEAKIATGWQTFVEVGAALTEIRDGELYRAKYKDFEEYCRDRWGYGRTHAYRLMDAAGVIRDLSPIGDRVPGPANEAQVRELVQVPAEKRVEAWKKSVAAAGENPVTAKVVRAAAAEFKPASKSAKAKKPVERPGVSQAILKPALRLIDAAELAAKAKDFAKVQSILGTLRKRLAEY